MQCPDLLQMPELFQSILHRVQFTIRYMRTECMDHEYVYGRKMPMEMLVRQVAESALLLYVVTSRRAFLHSHIRASSLRRRLVNRRSGRLLSSFVSSQSKGPHLFHTSPSGEYLEYRACAIGSRSQSAKTALARRFLNEETNVVTVSDDRRV